MKRMPEYSEGFSSGNLPSRRTSMLFARHGITAEQMEAAHD